MKISTMKPTAAPMFLIYGAEGRGKTTLASKFPKPLFIPLERGIPAGIQVDAVEGVNSYEATLGAMRELYKEPSGYQTLVFDGVEALEALLIEAVCAKHGWPNI